VTTGAAAAAARAPSSAMDDASVSTTLAPARLIGGPSASGGAAGGPLGADPRSAAGGTGVDGTAVCAGTAVVVGGIVIPAVVVIDGDPVVVEGATVVGRASPGDLNQWPPRATPTVAMASHPMVALPMAMSLVFLRANGMSTSRDRATSTGLSPQPRPNITTRLVTLVGVRDLARIVAM
jgi:hypothetical protein